MSITILRLGIDTLEASIAGLLMEESAVYLDELKAQAQELEIPQYLPLDSYEFAVQAQGSKPYSYKLAGNDASIRLTKSKKMPGASIRLSSLGLATLDAHDLFEDVAGIVGTYFGPSGSRNLSRIDVACDFQGFDPSGPHGAKFVCPAVFRPIYPNVEHPETFQFGKGAIVVRVYNKTAEIKKSGKSWLPELWAQHPGFDPDADVWRFEVQLRRERLCELGYPFPGPAIEDMADLLRYGIEWADLRIEGGKNTDQWERHPAWEELAAATNAHTILSRTARDKELAPLSRITPAMAGYMISAGAALDSGDFEQVWSIMEAEVRSRIGTDVMYANAVHDRIMERIGKGE